jgi:hypothetical protein
MALERAFLAPACWYEPRPLAGSFEHLRARAPGARAPALEYLGQILPRGTFRPVERIFEEEEPGPDAADEAPDDRVLAEALASAWRGGDAWMRACAVRASRCLHTPDPALFGGAEDEPDPLVQAELAAAGSPARRAFPAPGPLQLAPAGGGGGC